MCVESRTFFFLETDCLWIKRASYEAKTTHRMELREGTLGHASPSRPGRLQHRHNQVSRKARRYTRAQVHSVSLEGNESPALGKLEHLRNPVDDKWRRYKPGQDRLRIGVRRCLVVMQRYPLRPHSQPLLCCWAGHVGRNIRWESMTHQGLPTVQQLMWRRSEPS